MSRANVTLRALIIFSGAFVVAGCARTNHWQEEVLLSDGTVLTVSRAVHFEAPSGPLGEPLSRVGLEENMAFDDPTTGRRVEWFQPHFVAVRVDRINGRYVVIGELSTPCVTGFGHASPWQAYAYHDEGWVVLTEDEAPNVTVPNLLLDASRYSVTESLTYVSLREKERLNARSKAGPDARTIDLHRRPKC